MYDTVMSNGSKQQTYALVSCDIWRSLQLLHIPPACLVALACTADRPMLAGAHQNVAVLVPLVHLEVGMENTTNFGKHNLIIAAAADCCNVLSCSILLIVMLFCLQNLLLWAHWPAGDARQVQPTVGGLA
eukprot:GHRR01018334.1.p1 GENE.GHRR01018334.1~~GHRR01018334.1.p1  ORF type:complete len:130 (+),score=24.52 GHRR01018334.1:226-615(+)